MQSLRLSGSVEVLAQSLYNCAIEHDLFEHAARRAVTGIVGDISCFAG